MAARPHHGPRQRARWRRAGVAGLVALIVAVALGLRAAAAGWGLPYVEHHDEPSAANTALRMLRHGDWNPRFFEKPSLYYYALRLVFTLHWHSGLASGLYSGPGQLPPGTYHYMAAPGFFVWGRLLTALFGGATVLALAAFGRRWGTGVGLLAAALLAALPFHVRHSQYLTVDVLSGLTALLALGAALRLLDDGRWRAYALAGCAVGLATATKYNAAALALALVLAHGLRQGRAWWGGVGRLLWAGVCALAAFLAATPYALLTPAAFIDGLARQYVKYSRAPSGDLEGHWPLAGYLDFFWGSGLLLLPCLAALVGVGVLLARRDRAGLVLAGFTAAYLLMVLAQVEHFFRNLMPIIPPLALFSAIGALAGARWLSDLIARAGHTAVPQARRLALLLALLLLAQPLAESAAQSAFYARPYSKVLAGDYLRQHLPRGAPIAVDLNPTEWANQPFITPISDVARHDAAWYRAQGYRFLVANAQSADRERYPALRAAATLLASYPGARASAQPGPHMEVLDLGLHIDELAIERCRAAFGQQLELLGFQIGSGSLRAAFSPLRAGMPVIQRGQSLLINLYWRPLRALPHDFAVFLHLTDASGQRVAQRDTVIRAADYPTSRWQPGELAVDMADLYLPPDLPSGRYQLAMGVYRMETMERLALPEGQGDALHLATLELRG